MSDTEIIEISHEQILIVETPDTKIEIIEVPTDAVEIIEVGTLIPGLSSDFVTSADLANLSANLSAELETKEVLGAADSAIENHLATANHLTPGEVQAFVAHVGDTSNPHGTTAAQVGADPAGAASAAIAAHLVDADPHSQYINSAELSSAIAASKPASTQFAVARFANTSGDLANSTATINDVGDVSIASTTQSNSVGTGALVVGGGISGGHTLRMAGDVHCRFIFAPGTGTNSLRLGNATAAGNNGTAAGQGAAAGGANSFAGGLNASSAGASTVAIGSGASTGSAISNSVAIGVSTSSTGDNAVSLGPVAVTSAANTIAIGRSTTAGNQGSIVIGSNVSSSATQQAIFSGGTTNPISNVYFGAGVSAAGASSYPTTINGTGGSGTDVAGADIRIAGGRGTGTGAGGKVLLQVAAAGVTGATQNALSTIATVDSGGIAITSTTASTNTTTGAATIVGGLGVGGDFFLGGTIVASASGLGLPTTTTRSVGTRLVLSPTLTGSRADYALGMASSTFWMSTADSTGQFSFYGGTTVAATLSGTGILQTTNYIQTGGGVALPSTTTRSAGTRFLINASLSAANVDYALGIASGTLWYSVPQAISSQSHRFYGGTTELIRFQGDGTISIPGTLAITGRTTQGAPATAPADVNLANSQLSFWVDEVASALKVRVRLSNGTYKTGTIALT